VGTAVGIGGELVGTDASVEKEQHYRAVAEVGGAGGGIHGRRRRWE
jgi:hypothetical protein